MEYIVDQEGLRGKGMELGVNFEKTDESFIRSLVYQTAAFHAPQASTLKPGQAYHEGWQCGMNMFRPCR
jgi:hypothetical protein